MASAPVPISVQQHSATRWMRPTSMAFAAQTGVVPVSSAEVADVALEFALAFVNVASTYRLVALLGPAPDRNVFVGNDGRWLARYVPSALRGHPFALGRTADGQYVLCIDERSPFVEDRTGAQRIFQDDGSPTETVQAVMQSLVKFEHDRDTAAAAVAALDSARLIEPWPLVMRQGSAQTKLEGLFQISEAALGALSDGEFCALRRHGALALAYAQLLSVRNLQTIAKLTEAGSSAAGLPQTDGAFDFSWMDKS